MTLTITLPDTDEHFTLTPNEERRQAQGDSPDALLDGSHDGINACVSIRDTEYDLDVTALDGQHRDKAREKAVKSRLRKVLKKRGYTKRSAEEQAEDAMNNLRDALN